MASPFPFACGVPSLVVVQPRGCPGHDKVRDEPRGIPFERHMKAKSAFRKGVRDSLSFPSRAEQRVYNAYLWTNVAPEEQANRVAAAEVCGLHCPLPHIAAATSKTTERWILGPQQSILLGGSEFLASHDQPPKYVLGRCAATPPTVTSVTAGDTRRRPACRATAMLSS
jgi:hypothetical protein